MLSAGVLDSIYIIAKARKPKRDAVDWARSIGFDPDPWQADLLMGEAPNTQVNCYTRERK